MRNLIIMAVFFFASCDDHVKRIDFEIGNVKLIDVGKVDRNFKFESLYSNDTLTCKIHTISIKKNDTIASIKAFYEDKFLNIVVFSSPYYFDCNADSCFTMHDLKFDLIGLNGNYLTKVWINSMLLSEKDLMVSAK
jgi:hypothetical protein